MAKLTNLLKENINQRRRKVYLKAVIDMATAYSRRGYTQDEAIKDAAKGIENLHGYVLTPQDIKAVRHFVPENPQFKEGTKLKEEISRDEVVQDLESVQTIVDGKRGVAYIAEIGTDPRDWKAIQNLIRDNNLKAMHVKGNEHNAFVVYAQGHEKDAMELKNIAEKYGGYLAWNATKEDSRRIGELLNYKKSEIDDYIAQNYPDDLDEALDVSWNPYEDTDDLWWYVDEGYGIDWDGIMEIIKAAASKVVGETAPNRNSYFNIWYDIIDNQVTNASQNVDDYEDDDEVYGVVRSEVEYYTDPENWDDAKDFIVDQIERYTNIVVNKKTLANFQKMGILIHKMLNSKHKPSLSEALDVSWNPYEETNYKFKIGDEVYEDASENPAKVIEVQPNLKAVFKTKHNHAIRPRNWGDEDEPYYLVHKYGGHGNFFSYIWYPEELLSKEPSDPLNEALDVSWNPFQTWKDRYTQNSWLKLEIGSRGMFEGAEIKEIPNIEKYLSDRQKSDYKELLKYLKSEDMDEEDREGEIRNFKEFVGPFRLNKNNPSQWGYGLGEEDHELYYKILSDEYSEWVENIVGVYGVDFVDELDYDDIKQLDKLDYEF